MLFSLIFKLDIQLFRDSKSWTAGLSVWKHLPDEKRAIDLACDSWKCQLARKRRILYYRHVICQCYTACLAEGHLQGHCGTNWNGGFHTASLVCSGPPFIGADDTFHSCYVLLQWIFALCLWRWWCKITYIKITAHTQQLYCGLCWIVWKTPPA